MAVVIEAKAGSPKTIHSEISIGTGSKQKVLFCNNKAKLQ